MIIFLDLDGVMCELDLHIAKLYGMDEKALMSKWIPGTYLVYHVLPEPAEAMWNRVNKLGIDFWTSMPETPWARRLYDETKKVGDVYFLTMPTTDPISLAGKLEWIYRFTGDRNFRNYVMAPPKFLCAAKDRILIDDSDDNVDAFKKAGGQAILLPRIWNRMHAYRADPCEWVLRNLAGYVR